MVSSKQKGNLFDPFRGQLVAANPEEIVRQALLHKLAHHLGFPKQWVVVEKQLSELPHLKEALHLPSRRIDILCYSSDLIPLLLIECKEGSVEEEARAQAMGYNHHVGAAFVAVAGMDREELIHPIEAPFIPTYSQLLERLCP